MKLEQIQEIKDCLSDGRILFHYFKDRYALMLLSYLVAEGLKIREIKMSHFNRLLCIPLLKKILNEAGDGRLTQKELGSEWPSDYESYRLTIDHWGYRGRSSRFVNQTSRPGSNLVLQLNFSSKHDRMYDKLVRPNSGHPFVWICHPVVKKGNHTLAWARIDISMSTDEALIEEIQSDWIKNALYGLESMVRHEKAENDGYRRYTPQIVRTTDSNSTLLSQYIEDVLKPHMKMWDEAMLSAAIWFLKEEIGINKIFYHTFDFGCKLKAISEYKPPRSLYTKLPEKFCFRETRQAPSFLKPKNYRNIQKLLKSGETRFYLMDFAD